MEFVLREVRSLASRVRCGCRLNARIRNRVCGATKPVFEADLAEFRLVAGDERAFVELSAEVVRVRVNDYRARIGARAENALDESVEIERVRSTDVEGQAEG